MTNQDLEQIIKEFIKENLVIEIVTKNVPWEPKETLITLRMSRDKEPFSYEKLDINVN